MLAVGIEAMNVFGGSCVLDVSELALHRQLDTTRFSNLLMKEKSVALPYEDPVSMAVSAAKPIVDRLSQKEKDSIKMVITCSESGIDFSKSMSTYVHHYLELSRNCRLFEIKQACFSGTAGFQMAINFVQSQVFPGGKVLVVATDISRFRVVEGGEALTEEWAFAEPSNGAGAVAVLVSENPKIMRMDVGANGSYGYEVMDTCRPIPDSEAGDADLSLMSYLDCCENAFLDYSRRVKDVDYRTTFDYLAFHTPFGGMVKGAHRSLMRKLVKAKPAEIEADFQDRVMPGLNYCQRVGSIMGGTILLSILSTIENANINEAARIGCFSYGSGCCSEFYSGVVKTDSQAELGEYRIKRSLDERYQLTIDEYEQILRSSDDIQFGTRNCIVDDKFMADARISQGNFPRLYLTKVSEYKRFYEWV